MLTLNFEIDWVDAEGIRGPELSATWASLCIRTGESVITNILDTRAKTVRDFVYVPIYPLAEWLVANWWFLGHEFENPDKRADDGFRRRHSLADRREGYAFPNLEVISCGAFTRLVWKRDVVPWTKVRFLDQGEIWVDSSEFRESCTDLVDRVIRRLDSLGVKETFLQQEWTAIQDADEEEAAFCKTAAGLGWDPYVLDDEKRDRVLRLAENLGDVLGEAVPAMDMESPDQTWLGLVATIAKARQCNSLSLQYPRFFGGAALLHSGAKPYPWKVGYDFAQQLRQHLTLDGEPLPTMAKIEQVLGVDAGEIDRVTKSSGSSSDWPALVDAVVAQKDDKNPAFAFRQRGDDSRRFNFCRALGEVLMSPNSDTLITKAHSERQKRNRAFAAEFLAPSCSLRRRVHRQVVDSDDINEMAIEFGVSSRLIEHQIRNHQIAEVWDGD